MVVGLLSVVWACGAAAQDTEAVSAKRWTGREAEIEHFLRTADVLGLEDIPVGVTNPKSASLEPGGPVDKFAWKPLKPGIRRGFYESYKAEIAAYELDQLLGLGMVPVKVERRIRGELGAAVMWVSPAQSFRDLGGVPTPPTRYLGYWTIQLIRAKMFDNLIYNQDFNEGNWLVDPAWNLMVIDHSRSFSPDNDLVNEDITHVDRYLWERMQQLDEPVLTAALGEWLSDREIRAVLERRDRMGAIIDELVERNGEATVLLRYGVPPSATQPVNARATPPPGGTRDLVASLLTAVSKAPMIAPSSELTWTGTVVSLQDYAGRFRAVADAGVRAGLTVGLLSDDEGLLCLTSSTSDPTAFQQLVRSVGSDVEIFGVLAVGTEMPLVYVTVSRASS
jgi:hypothetical protein